MTYKTLNEIIDEFEHENIEYAQEVKKLLKEYNEEVRKIDKLRKEKQITGVQMGMDNEFTDANRKIYRELWKKIDVLKKKYSIKDDK